MFTDNAILCTVPGIFGQDCSLIEIIEMLVNIQTSIANILKKNKSVKTELTELTGTVAPVVNCWGGGGLKTGPGVESLHGGLDPSLSGKF